MKADTHVTLTLTLTLILTLTLTLRPTLTRTRTRILTLTAGCRVRALRRAQPAGAAARPRGAYRAGLRLRAALAALAADQRPEGRLGPMSKLDPHVHVLFVSRAVSVSSIKHSHDSPMCSVFPPQT